MEKQWRCKNDHILGMIRWNGNAVPQLMLFRHAIDMSAEHPADVDVIGPLIGRVPVRCELCDEVRLWEVSVDVLADLIWSLSHEQKEQLQVRLLKGYVRKIQKKRNQARMG